MVETAWHVAPLERYDQSLCALGLRLGVRLKQCSCVEPTAPFGEHRDHHADSKHLSLDAATTVMVRNLTRSDDAVWRAATKRFDRDLVELGGGCAAKKKGVG